MASLKNIITKNTPEGGKSYWLGGFRIASYHANYLTKTPKYWINILFPNSQTLKEDWRSAIPVETPEEAESKIKVILDKIIAELSE